MGRTETLAAVREKFPQYGDMSDDQLGDALAAKYPEYQDLAAPRPGIGEIAMKNLRAIPGKVVDDVTSLATKANDLVRGNLPKPSMATALPLALPGGGTVLTRVGSAAMGAVLDNPEETIGGNVETAGRGAVIPAASEVAGPIGSKLLRSLPWMKGVIANQDAAAYAREMGRQSPTLAVGAKNAEDLRRLAGGQGQQLLSSTKAATNAEINSRAGLLDVPSVAPRVEVPGHRTTSRATIDPEIQAQPRDVTTRVPGHTATQPMTFQEANDELSAIGARAFSKNPLDRNFNGVDQRRLYGQVYNDIKAALDKSDPTGKLTAMFEQAQADYAKGLALLRPLQKTGAFRTGEDLQLNTPHLQKLLANPKAEAVLRNKLGDEGFEALRNQMLRGGQPGEVDRLVSGSGRATDALMQWLRGSNTGFTQTVGVPLRTALPNVGSQYAGRAPYSLPPQLQAILDVVLQKSGGAALTPERR